MSSTYVAVNLSRLVDVPTAVPSAVADAPTGVPAGSTDRCASGTEAWRRGLRAAHTTAAARGPYRLICFPFLRAPRRGSCPRQSLGDRASAVHVVPLHRGGLPRPPPS